ncbi:MAG: hypothetical protein HKN44_04080 [Ilumatobacter sp.]|nr:hypothetical protein [Ilumatobacter sp.]
MTNTRAVTVTRPTIIFDEVQNDELSDPLGSHGSPGGRGPPGVPTPPPPPPVKPAPSAVELPP